MVYTIRGSVCITRFSRVSDFFEKKLCVLNIVLKKCSILRIVIYCLCAENSIFLPKYLRMCIFCCTSYSEINKVVKNYFVKLYKYEVLRAAKMK